MELPVCSLEPTSHWLGPPPSTIPVFFSRSLPGTYTNLMRNLWIFFFILQNLIITHSPKHISFSLSLCVCLSLFHHLYIYKLFVILPFYFKNIFILNYEHVWVWVYACGCEYDACKGQKRASDGLELGLQAFMSYLMSVQETEFKSSGRAGSTLNHWAISEAPTCLFQQHQQNMVTIFTFHAGLRAKATHS